MTKIASAHDELTRRVREALTISDHLGLVDTSIALNAALVSLDGKGTPGLDQMPGGERGPIVAGSKPVRP